MEITINKKFAQELWDILDAILYSEYVNFDSTLIKGISLDPVDITRTELEHKIKVFVDLLNKYPDYWNENELKHKLRNDVARHSSGHIYSAAFRSIEQLSNLMGVDLNSEE